MKTEVYSWRLSDLKDDLEEAARRERVSVARLLERIAREWLKARAAAAEDDEAEQERLRAIAMRYVGTLRSGDPTFSEKVSERVRELSGAHARSRSDRYQRHVALLRSRMIAGSAVRRSKFSRFRVPWATSAAVLTEFFYLASRDHTAAGGSVGLRALGARSSCLPIEDADPPALDELMRKYADRPMDFADATLVQLARRESLSTVFTIDHDDFETYRIEGRRRFRIVPDR